MTDEAKPISIKISGWLFRYIVGVCITAALGFGVWYLERHLTQNDEQRKAQMIHEQQVHTQDSLFDVMVTDSIRKYHWHFVRIDKKIKP